MKQSAPRAQASSLALLLALSVGCGSGAVPAQRAGTPLSSLPSEPSEHKHDTSRSHGPDTPPAQPEPAQPQASGAPAAPSPENAAYERAKSVLEKYCASCHTTGGAASSAKALEHFAMDGYPFGGHHAHEIGSVVRKSLGADGSKPTMPRGSPGAVKGEELAAVLAWADAFDAAHPAAKDHDKGHHAPHKH